MCKTNKKATKTKRTQVQFERETKEPTKRKIVKENGAHGYNITSSFSGGKAHTHTYIVTIAYNGAAYNKIKKKNEIKRKIVCLHTKNK